MTDIVTRLRRYRQAVAYQEAVDIVSEAAEKIETMRQQADDWKKIMVQKDKEIERLRAEAAEGHHEFVLAQINAGLKEGIGRLRALLTEAADELAQQAHDEHPYRDDYPDQMRRYNRDMELVYRIRNQQ